MWQGRRRRKERKNVARAKAQQREEECGKREGAGKRRRMWQGRRRRKGSGSRDSCQTGER
eukprot:1082674-Pleurochrysis_carterae.AAC.1